MTITANLAVSLRKGQSICHGYQSIKPMTCRSKYPTPVHMISSCQASPGWLLWICPGISRGMRGSMFCWNQFTHCQLSKPLYTSYKVIYKSYQTSYHHSDIANKIHRVMYRPARNWMRNASRRLGRGSAGHWTQQPPVWATCPGCQNLSEKKREPPSRPIQINSRSRHLERACSSSELSSSHNPDRVLVDFLFSVQRYNLRSPWDAMLLLAN